MLLKQTEKKTKLRRDKPTDKLIITLSKEDNLLVIVMRLVSENRKYGRKEK